MSDAPPPKLVNVSVQVPADLKAAVEALAEAEDRTLSAELRRLMRQRIDDAQQQDTKASA